MQFHGVAASASGRGKAQLMPHGVGREHCALLQARQQLAFHVVAADLAAASQLFAYGVGRFAQIQAAQGVVAQARRIEGHARRARGQHGRRSQAAAQGMPRENHVAFAESSNSALCQGYCLLVLLRCQAQGLSAVGFDIRPFRPEPLVRATEGNDILPLVIAVDGGVKAAFSIPQHFGSKAWNGNHLVASIQEVIARRAQTLPAGFFQLPFGLRARCSRFFGFVRIVGHHGQLQVQLFLRRRASGAAGESAIAHRVATAVVHLGGSRPGMLAGVRLGNVKMGAVRAYSHGLDSD